MDDVAGEYKNSIIYVKRIVLSGAWGLFIFFCLDAKENGTKRKDQGCISAATPADFYAKREKLASLRQFPAFYAPKCASALRRRADAGFLSFSFFFFIFGSVF